MQNTVKTEIKPSEDWNGFNFVFSNGWGLSIQQSEHHYCKVGKTAEVAIFDPEGNWLAYDERTGSVEVLPSADTHVNGHLNADDIAKLFAIVSEKKVDITAEV
jgi:hypothetical protein